MNFLIRQLIISIFFNYCTMHKHLSASLIIYSHLDYCCRCWISYAFPRRSCFRCHPQLVSFLVSIEFHLTVWLSYSIYVELYCFFWNLIHHYHWEGHRGPDLREDLHQDRIAPLSKIVLFGIFIWLALFFWMKILLELCLWIEMVAWWFHCYSYWLMVDGSSTSISVLLQLLQMCYLLSYWCHYQF